MIIEDVIQSDMVEFSEVPSNYYLLGLLSAFENRFQAMADNAMQEISWKQFFAIICMREAEEDPWMGNVMQILSEIKDTAMRKLAIDQLKCIARIS